MVNQGTDSICLPVNMVSAASQHGNGKHGLMGNMGYLFPSCITINAGLVRKQNSTLKPTPSIFFFPAYRRAIHSRRSSDMSNGLAPSSLSIHLSPCSSFSSSLTIVFYGLYLFLLYCLVCTVNRFCGEKKMIACFDS